MDELSWHSCGIDDVERKLLEIVEVHFLEHDEDARLWLVACQIWVREPI